MKQEKPLTLSLPRVVTDPNKAYPTVTRCEHIESCGLVLPWVMEWALLWMNDLSEPGETQEKPSLREYLQRRYGFPLYEFEGGKVDADGTYHSAYEEDPDLSPIVRIGLGELGVFYMYTHAMIAIPEGGGSYYVTRMD